MKKIKSEQMSLDEKIFEKGVHNWILASNVKQSIKELKEKLPNFTFDTDGTSHNLHDIIKEVFGKGLI